MRKYFWIIAIFAVLCFTIPVEATSSRLYFTESEDRLYYDGELLDDTFMYHTDMVPGSNFSDELIIENGTGTTYTLYFKVVPREQSEEANELLENITMRILLDGKVIYEGRASGLDYTGDGINLQNAVCLGEFTPSMVSQMIVETSLSTDYDNTSNREYSYIDWEFYGQYENRDPSEIVDVPNTMKMDVPMVPIVSVLVIVVGVGFLIYANKKEN